MRSLGPIVTFISEVTFQEAWSNHTTFDFKQLKVPVIGKEDLVKNKKATGRPKDLIDLELLSKKASRLP